MAAIFAVGSLKIMSCFFKNYLHLRDWCYLIVQCEIEETTKLYFFHNWYICCVLLVNKAKLFFLIKSIFIDRHLDLLQSRCCYSAVA